ncbi:MAG: urease accessory protein UreD [Streptosporangiaceae bacterium]
MRASAALVAELGADGATRLPVQRSEAPLVLRRTPEAVYLVGGAAGPLGGDVLELRIEVREGATLRLRTTAAAVALPGRDGRESLLSVTLTVAAGAQLEYLPEPTVAAAGARHRTEIRADLAAGAALVLRDEVVLGRYGERGGSCRTRLRADLAGAPLLRHELAVSGTDEVSLGPAVLAGCRTAGSLLCVEPGWDTGAAGQMPAGCAPGVAVMPLAGPAVLVTALAANARTLRQRLRLAAVPGPTGAGAVPAGCVPVGQDSSRGS